MISSQAQRHAGLSTFLFINRHADVVYRFDLLRAPCGHYLYVIFNKQMIRFLQKYSEVILWNGALILLAAMDPGGTTSLCILKNLGINWCPGCGLWHAVHHTLHFNFAAAYEAHLFGIPATLILFYQSCKSIYNINKTNNYGSTATIKNIP